MNVFRNGLIFTAGLLIAVPAWAQEAKKDAVAAEAAEVPVDAADAPAADAPVDAPVDGQTEKPAAEGAKGETVLGPGGRPLRTDYPGTDESLLSRMDTNQVQGLQIDGNQPQEAYQMRIQELETKIDDLKEKVFQSKTRIVLLRETLLSGNLAGARAILKAAQAKIGDSDLGQKLEGLKRSGSLDKIAADHGLGRFTLDDILEALARPGRDPRGDVPAPELRARQISFEDIREGMRMSGTVRNVVDFGAFVDLGVKEDGLVHISQMADGFVKNPHDVVAVGDRVDVTVVSVDTKRKRIGLSMV